MRPRWPVVFLLGLAWFLPAIAQAITITLAWDYLTSTQTGFQVFRCTGAACIPSTPLGSARSPGVRQAIDTTVSGGVTYGYGVQALDTPDSGLSAILYVPVPTPGVATHLAFPTPPQASTATNQSMNTVVVAVKDAFEATVAGSTASIAVALVPPVETAVPQAQLTLVSVDSAETVDASYPGILAIDGDPQTFWHTQYTNDLPPPPHTIIVDLGASYTVTSFRYLPRQDGSANGTMGQYQFFVSPDQAFAAPATISGTFPYTTTEKTVTFMGRTGRFVKLVAVTEGGGRAYTSMAELTILQTASGGGALAGTTSGVASGGQTSFPGLSVNQAGSYILQAMSSGLTGVTSPFAVVDVPIPTTVLYIIRKQP